MNFDVAYLLQNNSLYKKILYDSILTSDIHITNIP
jgi:hypothetical protein